MKKSKCICLDTPRRFYNRYYYTFNQETKEKIIQEMRKYENLDRRDLGIIDEKENSEESRGREMKPVTPEEAKRFACWRMASENDIFRLATTVQELYERLAEWQEGVNDGE